MTRLRDSLSNLEASWRSEDIELIAPSPATEVRDRLLATGKRISSDVIDVYSWLPGMANGYLDQALFCFWPLEEAIQRNSSADLGEDWLFGDHSIELFFFAFRFMRDHSSSVITCIKDEDIGFVAFDSAEQFFSSYAEADNDGRFCVLHGDPPDAMRSR